MKKEIICVGNNFYVINDRKSNVPDLIEVKDPRVIALRRKEGRTAYATPKLSENSLFADGPFKSYADAMSFVKNNGHEI